DRAERSTQPRKTISDRFTVPNADSHAVARPMLLHSLKTLSDVVDWDLCTGCGVCVYTCKKGAVRMVHVESEGYRPVFDDPSCRECTECLQICPGAQLNGDLETGGLQKQTEADHEFGPTLEIWEGWA